MKVSLGGLRNAIKGVYGEELSGVSPDRLKLYKIPKCDDAELHEIISTLGSGQLLHGNELLGKVFNDIPLSRTPRIVVEPLNESKPSRDGVYSYSPRVAEITRPPPSMYRHIGDNDPITSAREAFLKSAKTEKPSKSGTPSAFRTRQLGRFKPIPCGRPRDCEETVPTTLLHPVFGQFVDDCQSVEVTPEDNRFVNRLAHAMSGLYPSEPERFRAVDKEFQSYNIHFTISEIKNSGYITDADINVNGHRFVVAEFKNENCSGSTEPYFQAIGYYLESTRESAVKFRRSTLPCLLLSIFGWSSRPRPVLRRANGSFHRAIYCVRWCRLESVSDGTSPVNAYCVLFSFHRYPE